MSERHKILVVDDHDAGRFVKVQMLRRAGFEVIEASTGGSALATVARERPDLIVLDVNLPDISGLEVSRRLRENQGGQPALQILQISNTAVATEDRVRGLEQGADVYLVEPIEADVLIATVHALLRVHRAERALAEALDNERRARKMAEEASRLKDDFIATLSHELRTPLNALMGWIWQLKHGTLTEEARLRALDSLERNGRMQAQLINDLLDVSRISKGKLQLELRLIDLQQIIHEVSEILRPAVARKQIDFQVQAAPARVAGDRGRLQQIVTNLVTNAVQFTPSGGTVALNLAAENGDAVLTVRDTGAGIDSKFLPHVFDPFRQGEAFPSSKHGGLGLGLAVVSQLVDLHGGSVGVTSPGLGKGATFTVRLPRETPGVPIGQPDELLLKDVRLQLTTDDESWRPSLQAMLECSGATVLDPPAPGRPVPVDGAAEPDLIVTYSSATHQLTIRRPADTAGETSTVRPGQSAATVRRIAHHLAGAPRRSP